MNRMSALEWQRLQASQHNDGTAKHQPVMTGEKHRNCGGAIERANPPNLLTYCVRCGAIPSREVVRE